MKKRLLLLTLLIFLIIPQTVHVNGQLQHPIKQLYGMKLINSLEIMKSNEIFRSIKVTGTSGKYVVTGEARPHNGSFYYVVEDGHYIFISETEVKSNSSYPNWSKFTLHVTVFPRKLPDNGALVLYLFEKGNSNNEMKMVFPIVLEEFNK